jgi:type I restriction enzyme, R subunit
MANFISEDQIEKAAVSLLKDKYGYRAINCFTQESDEVADRSNRATKQEVVFLDILKAYAIKLNPAIPEPVIDQAIEKLTARRAAMSPLLANKEVYGLIRDGIPVQYEDSKGKTAREKLGS